jgi:polysaccharide chain length determinant protein (PEP-CTERM system associated)
MQILLPFLIIGLATFIYVRRLPDRYRAETMILVVPQRVPESYVRSTVSTRISDRLQSINQQIMSRSRLEPVIREFNLYPGLVRSGLMEDVVDRMRRDTAAQPVRGDAFRISYTAPDPRTAMKVTERLASMYIDENLRDREVLADGTNQFLESQLAAAKEHLIEHEKKLEEYNRRFAGQLPSNVGSNLQVLQNAQLQIQALVDSISRDKDRQMVLEGLLADLDASSVPDSPPTAGELAGPAAVPRGLAAQLDAAKKTLEELELRLKPEHPDVIHQRRTIADLQRKVDEQTAIARLQPQAPAPIATDRFEAARLNRIAQARAELASLGPQIAKKEQEQERLHGVVADYQGRVEAAPTRESELIELTRDYGTLQATYTSLLRKKEDAQISANLERYQIGEQFKILDPARMPEKPISPDRPRLYALGAMIGLGLGIALAAFLEFRDTTLKTDTDVIMALGLPVLALIPELVTDEEKAARRRRKLLTSVAAAGAAATMAGVLFWVFRWPSHLW